MSRDTGLDVTMLQAQAAVQSRAIDALAADVARLRERIEELALAVGDDVSGLDAAFRLLVDALVNEIVMDGGGVLGPLAEKSILAALDDAPASDPRYVVTVDPPSETRATAPTAEPLGVVPPWIPTAPGEPHRIARLAGSIPDLFAQPPPALPGDVADAARYANLPPPVMDAIRAILQARAVGDLGYAAASNVVDALAAWARALPPALDAETKALMREAAQLFSQTAVRWGDGRRMGLWIGTGNDEARLRYIAARLRAAAGPPP